MNLETEIKMLEELGKIKLKQKEQWYCDVCGEVINSAKEGMLEWDKTIDEEEFNSKKFRIVHHKKESPYSNCQTNSRTSDLADGHLHWYIGPNGLSELLSFYDYQKVDHRELNEIIRRLHVDFYEEARIYIGQSLEDGFSADPYQVGDYSQQDLLSLISKYASKD